MNLIQNKISKTLAIVLSIFLFSCENDFKKDDIEPSSGVPIINNIRLVNDNSIVTQGVLNGTYVLEGENLSSLVSISFNGVNAGFNPALLKDDQAFVRVPVSTPFVGQEDIMRVETAGGILEIDFPLLTITGFTEETIDGVKLVNLFGGNFSDATKVTFTSGSEEAGNLEEKEAEIVTVGESVLTVKVPSGITQAFIFVETSRGATAQSGSFGFSLPIYIDELSTGWLTSEWGGTHELASSEVALGDFSVKSLREAWSGLTFLPDDGVRFADFDAITVQIYGGTNAVSVNLALNDFSGVVNLPVTQGEWTRHTIPLRDFFPNGGEPEEIIRMDFQESSGTGQTQYIFYVDDFGFL